MMKKVLLAILLIQIVVPSFGESDQYLELNAGIISDGTNGYLWAQITNHGDEATTILTDNFTFLMTAGVVDGDTENIEPGVMMYFSNQPIRSSSTPPKSEMRPVTLQKGDSTCMRIELSPAFIKVVNDKPETIVPIKYTITKDLAEKYDLWNGELSLEVEAKSLMKDQTANQALEPTPAGAAHR